MRQHVQPVAALERCVLSERATFNLRGRVGRSVDTSHGPLFPTKKVFGLPSSHTHTSWRPPHLMRPPLSATLVPASPEQWATMAEPSRLAGACRAAREVAEV